MNWRGSNWRGPSNHRFQFLPEVKSAFLIRKFNQVVAPDQGLAVVTISVTKRDSGRPSTAPGDVVELNISVTFILVAIIGQDLLFLCLECRVLLFHGRGPPVLFDLVEGVVGLLLDFLLGHLSGPGVPRFEVF